MTAQRIAPATAPATDTAWDMPANLTPAEQLAYRKGYGRGVKAHIRANGNGAVVNAKPYRDLSSAERRMLSLSLAGTMRAAHDARHAAAHKAGMSAVRTWVRKYDAAPADRLAAIVDPIGKTARPTRTRKPAAEPVPVASVPAAGLHIVHVSDTGARELTTAPAPTPEIDNSPEATAARRTMFAGLGWSTTPPDHGVSAADVASLAIDPDKPEPAPVDAVARAYAAGVEIHATRGAIPPGMSYPAARAWRRETRRELARLLRARDLDPRGDVWTVACVAAGLMPEVSA